MNDMLKSIKEKIKEIALDIFIKVKSIYKKTNKAYVIASVIVVALAIFIACKVHDDKLYKQADEKFLQAQSLRDEVINYERFAKNTNKTPYIIEYTNANNNNDEIKRIYDNDKEQLNYIRSNYLYNRINFSKIDSINQDEVAGWLYIPGTSIDYIVMQGTKDEPTKYLWKDPYGNASTTGSLFIDYREPNTTDGHTIIYGHRLKNHQLYFGQLLNYNSRQYAIEHNYAYFYTKDSVTEYTLCSVNNGNAKDMIYTYPYTVGTQEYDLMVNEAEKTITQKLKDFDTTKEMLVLSTCSGRRANRPERLFLIFQKDGTMYFNE